ncbi:MAG: hypothetical protein JSS60_09505 [Verrucomicrobia bacterium]|nr:hypothetical protein [Verrucomicrobiota bacterium]
MQRKLHSAPHSMTSMTALLMPPAGGAGHREKFSAILYFLCSEQRRDRHVRL